MNQSKTRWIAGVVAGASWGAVVAAMLIQPHIQVYMTIWLATLVSSLVAAAIWMTRPDHGLLGHVRLKIAAMRLDEAIKEERAAAGISPEDASRFRRVA